MLLLQKMVKMDDGKRTGRGRCQLSSHSSLLTVRKQILVEKIQEPRWLASNRFNQATLGSSVQILGKGKRQVSLSTGSKSASRNCAGNVDSFHNPVAFIPTLFSLLWLLLFMGTPCRLGVDTRFNRPVRPCMGDKDILV